MINRTYQHGELLLITGWSHDGLIFTAEIYSSVGSVSKVSLSPMVGELRRNVERRVILTCLNQLNSYRTYTQPLAEIRYSIAEDYGEDND